jgi:lysophospholipase L1-like esterase
MKNILCYGDSNTWGARPIEAVGVVERYGPDVRWTGVMRSHLGEGYQVIDEGLNARTTVHDDPIDGAYKNGLTYFRPCLESHVPLDLVIIMLGTNDLKSRFSLTAYDIASGIKTLLEVVQSIGPKNSGVVPQTLVIAPPPLARLSVLAEMFTGGTEKSLQFAPHYETFARLFDCDFLNAGDLVTTSDLDGVHFDADQHQVLGQAVAATVLKILE